MMQVCGGIGYVNYHDNPILSMLATLAISYGINQWLYYQQRISRQNSTFAQAYTWVIIGGLVLLLVWLVFSWYVLVKSQRNIVISVVYIVFGVLAFIWVPLELVSPFWMTHLFLFPNLVYNLQYSGILIAVLGILTLFIPKASPVYPPAARSLKPSGTRY